MTKIDCTSCTSRLPDLFLEDRVLPSEVASHLAQCQNCRQEWTQLRATFALMDEWSAPEPSAYFDTRMHARLREAQAAAPEGLWERFTIFLRFGTGRELRPAVAGTLGLAMLLGGGTAATILTHHAASSIASPAVNDLKIYDNNAQALQQMDLLDDGDNDGGGAPQS